MSASIRSLSAYSTDAPSTSAPNTTSACAPEFDPPIAKPRARARAAFDGVLGLGLGLVDAGSVCVGVVLGVVGGDTPGVEEPGVEEPGVEEPGVDTPGVEDPGVRIGPEAGMEKVGVEGGMDMGRVVEAVTGSVGGFVEDVAATPPAPTEERASVVALGSCAIPAGH